VNFLLGEIKWTGRLSINENLGLLEAISLPMAPDTVQSLPARLIGKRLRFESAESFAYVPGSSIPGFEMAIAQSLGPCTVRRFVQPFTQPWSLAQMAACQQVPLSPTVNVYFGWLPIEIDEVVFHLDVCVLFFDVHGNMVDRMSGGMSLSDKKGFGGRAKLKDARQKVPGFWPFSSKREYFADWIKLSLKLDRLQTDICSIAFVVLSQEGMAVEFFT
jgi:hypothetical protein